MKDSRFFQKLTIWTFVLLPVVSGLSHAVVMWARGRSLADDWTNLARQRGVLSGRWLAVRDSVVRSRQTRPQFAVSARAPAGESRRGRRQRARGRAGGLRGHSRRLRGHSVRANG